MLGKLTLIVHKICDDFTSQNKIFPSLYVPDWVFGWAFSLSSSINLVTPAHTIRNCLSSGKSKWKERKTMLLHTHIVIATLG